MARTFSAVLAGLLFFASVAALEAKEKSADALQRDFQNEKNPKKRASIAMELMDVRLKELRDFLGSGTMLQEPSPPIDNYASALDRLVASVRESANVGTSKSVEMHLRRHLREFENFKVNVSVAERPTIETVITRLLATREEVLYNIMHPKEEKRS